MDKSVENAQTRKAPKGGGRVPPKSVSAELTLHEGRLCVVCTGRPTFAGYGLCSRADNNGAEF